MSSLAELPEVVGFFSYSREDDDDSKGALSALRDRIQRELRGQLGRTRAQFRLFQDTVAIAHGTLWEEQIKSAIAQSVFFVPIITPTAVNSRHCKTEFELFLAREVVLGREDLIFPILHIRVPELAIDELRRQNDVLKIIHARQYADWTKSRQRDVASFEVGKQIEEFCQDIVDALRKPWVSPDECRRKEEAEAQRRAEEEERRRQEAETKGIVEKERREAERQRLEREAMAKREAEEKAHQEERQKKYERRRDEAEGHRAEDDRRRSETDAERPGYHLLTSAAASSAETIDAMDDQETGPRKPWLPSRRALLIVCLLGVSLFWSVGFWLANPHPTPAPVTPESTPVQPPAREEQPRRTEVQADNQQPAKPDGQARQTGAAGDKDGALISRVLGSTETQWKAIFAEGGKTYQPPVLVMYNGVTPTGCGSVQSATGPFYCPTDQKVYLDTSFFREMENRFHGCSSACQFSKAYVIAHEVGHHVQNLLGILPKVQQQQQQVSKVEANQLQVRVELQADCLAGVWANRQNQQLKREGKPPFIEPGDVEAAMQTASAIGDDSLQRQATGRVVPDSFTYGTSAQRQRWFMTGLKEGNLAACNTFRPDNL